MKFKYRAQILSRPYYQFTDSIFPWCLAKNDCFSFSSISSTLPKHIASHIRNKRLDAITSNTSINEMKFQVSDWVPLTEHIKSHSQFSKIIFIHQIKFYLNEMRMWLDIDMTSFENHFWFVKCKIDEIFISNSKKHLPRQIGFHYYNEIIIIIRFGSCGKCKL